MNRLSHYNIYLEMKNGEGLLIQGMYGSFDVVEPDIYAALRRIREEQSGMVRDGRFPEDILAAMKRRGYITELDPDAEVEQFKKICGIISGKRKKGIELTIIPTYNCNFRCEYCFEGPLQERGGSMLAPVMSEELVDATFAALDKYIAAGYTSEALALFGGEPLLRKNYGIVRSICEKAAERKLKISCVTNGYDLDRYLELIKEFGFDGLQITIDGVGEGHNRRRFLAGGQGTFEKISENVGLALENGVNIVLRTNVNRKNLDEIKKLAEYYTKKGWTNYENFRFYFKSTHKCYELVENQYSDIELLGELGSVCAELGLGDSGEFVSSSYFGLKKMLRKMLKGKSFAPVSTTYCGSTNGMLVVDPFANLYPCWDIVGRDKLAVGKVDVANGEFVFNDQYDAWKNRTVEKIERCSRCPYALFCGGGCPAFARVEGGSIYSAYCDDFQRIFDGVAVEVCEEFLNA